MIIERLRASEIKSFHFFPLIFMKLSYGVYLPTLKLHTKRTSEQESEWENIVYELYIIGHFNKNKILFFFFCLFDELMFAQQLKCPPINNRKRFCKWAPILHTLVMFVLYTCFVLTFKAFSTGHRWLEWRYLNAFIYDRQHVCPSKSEFCCFIWWSDWHIYSRQ